MYRQIAAHRESSSPTKGGITMANISKNGIFMNLKGIDRIEALWYNSVKGTPFLQHPVSRKRAHRFLESVKSALS